MDDGSPLKFSGGSKGEDNPAVSPQSGYGPQYPIQSDSLAINFDFDIRPIESLCLLSGVFCLCTKILMLLLTHFPTVMKSMLSILNDVIKAWCTVLDFTALVKYIRNNVNNSKTQLIRKNAYIVIN